MLKTLLNLFFFANYSYEDNWFLSIYSTEFRISGYQEPVSGPANLTVLLILSVVLILLLTCLLGLVTTIINSHLLSKEIRTGETRSNNTTQNFQENLFFKSDGEIQKQEKSLKDL